MPKRKPFVCKTCDRSFSMAAHLARHSRVHAKKQPTNKRRLAAKPGKVRARANGAFSGLVTSLQQSHRALIDERDALSTQITALESALSAMGSTGTTRTEKTVTRATTNGKSADFRTGSLKDYIHRALSKSDTPLPVAEITSAVVSSGFKSKNKTLGTSVGIALSDMPGIRRVSRGVYGLR